MHYYQFNIGDYATHTRHLSIYEDIAYRRLLDWYYLNEKPIPLDPHQAARLILMKDKVQDVQTVLSEFFQHSDEGWINKRADLEIAAYKGFSDAGKRGAAKRWGKGVDTPPIAPPIANINHKPITNNHKPRNSKKTKTNAPLALLSAAGIPEQLSNDWMAIREKKNLPLTKTALDAIEREGGKVGLPLLEVIKKCCEEGWAGFKASWLLRDGVQGQTQKDQAREEARKLLFGKGENEAI